MIPPLQFSPPAVIVDSVALVLAELERRVAKPRPTAADVHKIRVCCKKLRSWIRLLRGSRGADARRHADKALRKILRELAPARDGTVLPQTIARLQINSRSERNRAACRQVLACLKKRAPAASMTRTSRLSKRVTRPLLADVRVTDKMLKAGLHCTHARCLRLARLAVSDTRCTKRVHRLRRWVKYLAYQLELVTVPTPSGAKFREQLACLGAALGRSHDLVVLQQQLRTVAPPGYPAGELVTAQARRLERRLLRQAAVLAGAVFGL